MVLLFNAFEDSKIIHQKYFGQTFRKKPVQRVLVFLRTFKIVISLLEYLVQTKIVYVFLEYKDLLSDLIEKLRI